MKKMIVIFILSLFSFNAYSQWGIKGGVNNSDIAGQSMAKVLVGGHIGGTYDIQLSKRWYLQPELQFTLIGANLGDDGGILKGGHIRIYALEAPIIFSFRPSLGKKIKLLVDMGLYARYGLFGNATYNYYKYEEIQFTDVDKSPFDGAFNRFDMGLNVGLGLQVSHYYGMLTYQRGLSHASRSGDDHMGLKLSFGYKF